MTVDTSSEQLGLRVERDDDESVIHVAGELDPHTAPLLQREVDLLCNAGARSIVLELSGLAFVDSSGLRVIIRAHQEVTRQGNRFVLRNPSLTARRLLEITGLTDLLEAAAS